MVPAAPGPPIDKPSWRGWPRLVPWSGHPHIARFAQTSGGQRFAWRKTTSDSPGSNADIGPCGLSTHSSYHDCAWWRRVLVGSYLCKAKAALMHKSLIGGNHATQRGVDPNLLTLDDSNATLAVTNGAILSLSVGRLSVLAAHAIDVANSE